MTILSSALFRREKHNIKPRSLGIVFRDLRVSGLTAASSYFPTLGSLFNPRSIIENVQSLRHPNVRDILSGFEGVVKPGEMIRESYSYYLAFFPLNLAKSFLVILDLDAVHF